MLEGKHMTVASAGKQRQTIRPPSDHVQQSVQPLRVRCRKFLLSSMLAPFHAPYVCERAGMSLGFPVHTRTNPASRSSCGRARLRPNVVFESGQFTTILAMVGGGPGASVVPQMAVERRKGCRFIPIADERSIPPGGDRAAQAAFPKSDSTFLQHLQRSAAD